MSEKVEPTTSQRNFKLEVPLDASGVEGFEPDRQVKVAAQDPQGVIQSLLVKINKEGKGIASFSFAAKPGKLSIAVGPPDATDQEVFGLQTLRVEVPARLWKERQVLYPAIRIPAYYWHWWWRWCRTFTVRGRVVCPDGQPVPGAKVCAFDVDSWWWYTSKQQVGCDVTDQNGTFSFKFRWCCGWWPWWWWRTRVWYLDASLIARIGQILHREPRLHPIPLPDPTPEARIFEQLLGKETFASLNLKRHSTASLVAARSEGAAGATVSQRPLAIDPNVLADLREPLLARLPRAFELERLRIWPWWPWQPWSDCTPDLIFRVTQNCGQSGTVIVDEGWDQVRWNIPTSLDVTLTANDKACCLADLPDCVQGDCAVLTDVCGDPINDIGGNPGAAPAPVGYLNPGAVADAGDRPYGGNVLIQGQVGCDVDYYEFQWSSDHGATWHDMDSAAVGDIPRQYWIPATNTFQVVPFLTSIGGRLVFESRQHYEATHDPGTWGVSRFWMAANATSLMSWLTQTPFLNGTYRLRIKGWQLVGGNLANPQNLDFLPTCSTQTPAELVLQIDNRLVGVGSGHPATTIDHPCGEGTVHTCTLEPDTDFVSVRIVPADPTKPAQPIGPCTIATIAKDDVLEVDFLAYDPEGHLGSYSLYATYGENQAQNLLNPATIPSLLLPGFGLSTIPTTPVPEAEQVGPTYRKARLDGAIAPTWRGGGLRLRVKAAEAFPETCCYQLELRAYKRTIVSCTGDHSNTSEYSFMIVVPS